MIYLDHNATTPILPEVIASMQPYFADKWGNPSSSYHFGSGLKRDIAAAREQVASLIGARQSEVIFTSGATESNNSAIHNALQMTRDKRHVITSSVEHSSVLEFCQYIEKVGGSITYLPVDKDGLLNVTDIENAITEHTALVSIMWANNESGVLFPVESIAQVCKKRGVLFHCDAVQAVGKLDINLRNSAIDYLSLTGHKIGAPKGIGALYIRKGAPFHPYVIGGHQERSYRGGTENVAFIVGLGKASEFAISSANVFDTAVRELRDHLESEILSTIPDTELNGHKENRIADRFHVPFDAGEVMACLLIIVHPRP